MPRFIALLPGSAGMQRLSLLIQLCSSHFLFIIKVPVVPVIIFVYLTSKKYNENGTIQDFCTFCHYWLPVCGLPDEITGDARAANAFTRHIRKELSDPSRDWTLDARDSDTWVLCRKINGEKTNPLVLARAEGY